MTKPPKLEDFPHRDYDKLRYGDLDGVLVTVVQKVPLSNLLKLHI